MYIQESILINKKQRIQQPDWVTQNVVALRVKCNLGYLTKGVKGIQSIPI